jgi:beta-galactosidase
MSLRDAARLFILLTFGSALLTAKLAAQQPQDGSSEISIDAREAARPPQALPFAVGGASPDGHVLGANSRYLTFDGQPWFPIMGEFHYSRYAAADWEDEILKMKAGGIEIISTYIFWIHHEEIEGQFDWSRQRDLRHFVELCGKHGMLVWIRIGPWAHGEVRNGGLPDWVVQQGPVRQNAPRYLESVGRFYGEIGRQVKGLFWQDGGPIVGVQIENEYHERGPGKGAEHLLALTQIARQAGLDAPFYTATAWDDAVVPSSGFLPVFSGYGEQFWNRKTEELPPSPNYFFTRICCDENVGDDLQNKRPDIDARYASLPFLVAEMGGGMELSYHRRPLMNAADTAAMAVVKLGSGVTLYGYYMFHGGTNPEGKKTTLQESQATGYPNDLPVKSYDFQAPLGEFGQMNESFRELKSLHLFLHDFGGDLATMTPYFPEQMPESKSDTKTPRLSARLNRDSGFIFINNYQRNHPLPDRKNLQVRLQLSSGAVEVPERGVDIPSGAYLIWPVNLDIGGTTLAYSTAQLLCKLDTPSVYVFFAWPGVAAQFAFDASTVDSLDAPRARVLKEHGRLYVEQIKPGQAVAIRVRSHSGQETQILVVSQSAARNIWKAQVAGQERLVLTAADTFFDRDRMHLRSDDPRQLSFGVYPAMTSAPSGFSAGGHDGAFALFKSHVSAIKANPRVKTLANASNRPPATMGKEVAEAPEDEAFAGAARWSITIPPVRSQAVKNLILRINYQGDVARIYEHGKLTDDDFFHGAPWEIGLDPTEKADPQFELSILPLRADAPIYLPSGKRPDFPVNGQVAKVLRIQLVPEYEAIADLKP